ncbi:MAG: BadF/BadG/BcrA/BcrD ATPase family protein [bacterium]|nr:BadF/BadG/BcrA/BcrD ATPase family protein [bacterium]
MEKKYVIGVDGGGTKTVAALANLEGKILAFGKSGSSNVRNVGLKIAVENIAKAIEKVLKKTEKSGILSTFIGLAVIQEEPRLKEKVKKALFKYKEISPIFKGKLEIDSDQIVAFRAGSNERNGVSLIAGTGCVAHGWRKGKEEKSSGWDWLADEGSAFWVGQKAFQVVFKDLDGRGQKTKIKEIAFRKFKIKNEEELMAKVYSKNPIEIIPYFSIFCDLASKRGDKIAKNIMREAGKELSISAKTVIKKLGFQKVKFPLVLVGGIFQSKIVLRTVKREVKKFAPKTEFIQPKNEPVVGAVKLAIEHSSDSAE